MSSQQEIRDEMDQVISDLESKGVKYSSNQQNITGLGDVVESVLQSFGITQERFNSWFNLKECNCTKRKKWLNSLFSWKKNQG
jgi:hypothetical protein